MDDQSAAIAFLSDPASYDTKTSVERMETHASIVFLVGERAYKLKRAVSFSYLDYATVEARKRACESEYRLNLRTAPSLYLAVRSIRRGKGGGLSFDGPGDLVDSVVVMRRFDQASLLDNLARRGGLNRPLMQELADAIAAFHRSAEVDREYGGPARLSEVIESNGANLALASPLLFAKAAVDELTAMSGASLRRWERLIEERRQAGKVRLCHGDLHLRNICMIEGHPTLFDCVEFNRALACIDTLYDLSFLLMDLIHRDFCDWASFVFNRYFDRESEIEGVVLLPLFMSLHAAIRAHVTAASPEAKPGSASFEQLRGDARRYFAEASRLLVTRQPQLLAIGGPSGTGKSTLAYALAPALGHAPGARVLRSDVIRKRLLALPPETRLPPEAYSTAATRRVYAAMLEEARALLASGQSVILDAVFAKPQQRAAARSLAGGTLRFHGIWLDAPSAVLEARIETRSNDASDATLEVVRQQLRGLERPSDWSILDATGSLPDILAGARDILSGGAPRPVAPAPR